MSSSGNISPSSSTKLLTATCGMQGGISGQSIIHFILPPVVCMLMLQIKIRKVCEQRVCLRTQWGVFFFFLYFVATENSFFKNRKVNIVKTYRRCLVNYWRFDDCRNDSLDKVSAAFANSSRVETRSSVVPRST